MVVAKVNIDFVFGFGFGFGGGGAIVNVDFVGYPIIIVFFFPKIITKFME